MRSTSERALVPTDLWHDSQNEFVRVVPFTSTWLNLAGLM
jgi:hypothetical protein